MSENLRKRQRATEWQRLEQSVATLMLSWVLEQLPLIRLENTSSPTGQNLDIDYAEDLIPPLERYDPAIFLRHLYKPTWSMATLENVYFYPAQVTCSPQTTKSSTTSTFHPFQRLPRELRFKIWK